MEGLLATTKNFLSKIEKYRRGSSHELGIIWSEAGMEHLKKYLENSRDVKSALKKIQTYLVTIPTKPPVLAVNWHLNYLKQNGIDVENLPAYFDESDFAPKEALVEINGRSFLPDIFRHFGHLKSLEGIKELWSKNETRVLELGAGTGYLARLINQQNQNVKYVIIDIPETLCFSFMRLSDEFPDKKVLLIDQPGINEKYNLQDFDLIFCPTTFKNEVLDLNYDLFINTASFGEMKSNDVADWFDTIQQKIKPTYIFSVNRYLNTLIPGEHDWRHEENGSCLFFNGNWKILDWELEPGFLRCPWNNKYARYLLILAKYQEGKSIDVKQESQRLLEEANSGSWNDPPLAMSIQDNVLVSDMTKSGVLYRLWNSIRYNENQHNLYSMLKYLDTLIHKSNYHFEEYFYYLRRLGNLIKNQTANEGIQEYYNHNLTRFDRNPGYIKLVDSLLNYNIVRDKSGYFALQQALGPLDLGSELIGEREFPPYVLRAKNLHEIKNKILCVKSN